MARPGALVYLRTQLGGGTGFLAEWNKLSDEDKATLRRWADEEMDALGMEK